MNPPLADLCGEAYTRPSPNARMAGHLLTCQYLRGHRTANHSWFAVQKQDEADAITHRTVTHPEAIVAMIRAGWFDPNIEQLLASLHDRKRSLRGVVGFPREG